MVEFIVKVGESQIQYRTQSGRIDKTLRNRLINTTLVLERNRLKDYAHTVGIIKPEESHNG